MHGSYRDKARLQHILDAIVEIESFIDDNKFEDFLNNSMMQFACIKLLEIIGEATKHISNITKSNASDIAWDQIVGMRNIFVHEYFGIDLKVVWSIISVDLPPLKIRISDLLTSID